MLVERRCFVVCVESIAFFVVRKHRGVLAESLCMKGGVGVVVDIPKDKFVLVACIAGGCK